MNIVGTLCFFVSVLFVCWCSYKAGLAKGKQVGWKSAEKWAL